MDIQYYHSGGKVYLVGAGPGDPDLITVKGAKVLEKADIIVYDRLANPKLLSITSEQSEHIYVGKRPDKPSVSQAQINHILITKAREGKIVARLKGGDPFVFGRGGEECEALSSENIPFEVVPGISSALAAPAFAGIPVTQRNVARSFTVVTGHTISNTDTFANWDHLVHADTLIVLMGMRKLPQIAETLIKYGRDADTPIGVIEKATYQSQKTVFGTLGTIAEKIESLSTPGTIVIGELVAKSNQLAWFKPEENTKATAFSVRRQTQFAG
jgi:uroporphyrin-III C-methyltransferase